MSTPFEIVIPTSVFDEEDNQYQVAVSVRGSFYYGQPPNPHADNDWDSYGVQSYFDYEVLATESTENKKLDHKWWDNQEFEIDLYDEIKDVLYELFEKDSDE